MADEQTILMDILEDVDWSVISFSSCQNCGKDIYHGPRKSSGKEDNTAACTVWRHVHTQSNSCDRTRAVPVENNDDIFCEKCGQLLRLVDGHKPRECINPKCKIGIKILKKYELQE